MLLQVMLQMKTCNSLNGTSGENEVAEELPEGLQIFQRSINGYWRYDQLWIIINMILIVSDANVPGESRFSINIVLLVENNIKYPGESVNVEVTEKLRLRDH
ncbi:hypothetical protein JTB14_002754 [Gonioctena quinquepunctata]|nr:hypothetical protein JTB14_002754 [Gonioctena quinquepunctata]